MTRPLVSFNRCKKTRQHRTKLQEVKGLVQSQYVNALNKLLFIMNADERLLYPRFFAAGFFGVRVAHV